MDPHMIEKNARRSRRKAFLFTVVAHLAVFGLLAYSTSDDPVELIPDTVKEWVGIEQDAADEASMQEKRQDAVIERKKRKSDRPRP